MPMDARRPAAVENTGLFRGLDDEGVRDILSSGVERRLEGGDVLLRQGDAASAVFLVLSGQVRMTTVDAQGLQKTLRFMADGDEYTDEISFTIDELREKSW